MSVKAGFGGIHQQAAQVLADNTFQRLQDVVQVIGRQAEGIYRDLALESVRGAVVGYDTWKQAANRYREQLADRGVTGFKDKAGRMWNMRRYTEMVARTTTQEAHTQGTLNRLSEQGHDLIIVSRHRGACPLCAPWEGKVLSITGKTRGYPTFQEAKTAGLMHPNCRHIVSLYIDLDKEIEELEGEEREPALTEYENTVIPPEKLTKYALNKEHTRGGRDKAFAFELALGYTVVNYQNLIEKIHKNLPHYPAVFKGSNQYGDKYEVVMDITGPNGKTAKVLTARIKYKNGEVKLVSVYVDD